MWQAKVREFCCNSKQRHPYFGAKIKGGGKLKLKALVLLALALLAFSIPVLMTLNASAPNLSSTLWDIIKNDSSLRPCGEPINDPELPH
jgi:hypothetical protein